MASQFTEIDAKWSAYLEGQREVIRAAVSPWDNRTNRPLLVTNDELNFILHYAKIYGLDPLTGDLHWDAKRKRPITGHPGYLKIAERDPNFNGVDSGEIYQEDEFEVERELVDGELVITKLKHTMNFFERKTLLGAYAVGRYAGRPDKVVLVRYQDYKLGSQTWTQYKDAMIRKSGEIVILRAMIGISGLYTEEELGEARIIDAVAGAPHAVALPPSEGTPPEVATDTAPEQPSDETPQAEDRVEEGGWPAPPVEETPAEAPPVEEPTPQRPEDNDYLSEEQYLYLGAMDQGDREKITATYGRFMGNLEETGKLVRMADGFETAVIACWDNPAVLLKALAGDAMEEGVPPPAEDYLLPHIQAYCKDYRKAGGDSGVPMIEVMQGVGFFCLSEYDQEENSAWKDDVVKPFVQGFCEWAVEKHVKPDPPERKTMGTQDTKEESPPVEEDATGGDADSEDDVTTDSILNGLEDGADDDEDLVEAG